MSEEEFAASFSLVTQVCLRREAEAHLEVDCFRFCPKSDLHHREESTWMDRRTN